MRALAIWTGILFIAVAATTWFLGGHILQFLLVPVEGQLSPFPGGPPVFTTPTGIFSVRFELAWRGALLVTLPVFIAGLYRITPVIPRLSRQFLYFYLPAVLGLYVAGLAFVYLVMIPRGVGFLLNFGTDVAIPLITINSYFNLLKNMLLFVPLAFQLPLVMWLLAKSRIVTYGHVMKIRKIVPLGTAFFSAVITPTVDPINFLIMWIPMLLLFEVGMFLMWMVEPEQGNYLWAKSIRNGILRLWHLPCRVYWKLVGRPLGRLWRLPAVIIWRIRQIVRL